MDEPIGRAERKVHQKFKNKKKNKNVIRISGKSKGNNKYMPEFYVSIRATMFRQWVMDFWGAYENRIANV